MPISQCITYCNFKCNCRIVWFCAHILASRQTDGISTYIHTYIKCVIMQTHETSPLHTLQHTTTTMNTMGEARVQHAIGSVSHTYIDWMLSIHIHTHIHIHIRIHIHIHIHIRICICIRTWGNNTVRCTPLLGGNEARMVTRAHTHAWACTHACTHARAGPTQAHAENMQYVCIQVPEHHITSHHTSLYFYIHTFTFPFCNLH